MSVTRYFLEQVMRKRPYVSEELCRTVARNPIKSITQADGRIRYWGSVLLPNETETRIMRVIVLEDGITLHNAFIDRDLSEDVT